MILGSAAGIEAPLAFPGAGILLDAARYAPGDS